MPTNRLPDYSDDSPHCGDSTAHAEQSNRRAIVRKQLLTIGREYQSKTIEMSILLEECHRERYWQEDFVTFNEYVEAELGISTRTAQDLTRTIRACQAANVSVEEIHRLGWSKVSVVASHLTSENAAKLLMEVEGKSCRELRNLVRNNKSLTAAKKATTVTRKMPRQIELSAMFEAALRLACQHTRDLDIESNLKFIADKFIEFCPPPSALLSANHRN
jgi:hypothetical protein